MGNNDFAMGWIKDYPDFRDFSPLTSEISDKHRKLGQKESVKQMLETIGIKKDKEKKLPAAVDLREWCSPIEDQLSLGACTAHAAIGVLEYFEKKAFGTYLDASRLFLYKITRKLLQWEGDTGAYLRTTMGAMVMFGVPLEKYWPYDIDKFDEEPSAFLYGMAQSYQAINYYRLDPPGIDNKKLLQDIKSQLAAGLPCMFGFTCYSSLEQADDGKIPFPQNNETVVAGHAVAAFGYDDKIEIKNGSVVTKGALLIRNSWGTKWGTRGYGYLPYEYILRGIAADFWCLIRNEWLQTGAFGF